MAKTDSQSAQRPGSQTLLFRGVAAVLATLFSIAFVEVGLRLIREPGRFYPHHPNSRSVMFPSEEITPGITGPSYFTVNSYGARGPDPEGQSIRILAIGGSTTACTALNDDETWPALLMQYLNEDAVEDPFWVTNSGIDGKNSHHHLMHAKYWLPQLPEIDYVIIYAGLNDVGMWLYISDWDPNFLADDDNWASRVGESFRLSNFTPANYPWYKRFEIWKTASIVKAAVKTIMVKRERDQGRIVQDDEFQWMQKELKRREEAEKRFVHRAKMETLPAALDSYARNLKEIADLVREAGATPIFMAQAMDHNILTAEELRHRWMGAMDGGKTYIKEEQMHELLEAYNDRMEKVAETDGVLYIDLPELLTDDRDLFYDGHHFNEHGARVTARRIADTFWASILKDGEARKN